VRDRAYLQGMERWFTANAAGTAGAAGAAPGEGAGERPAERPAESGGAPVPPMFAPFRLRGMELVNRVVVSPMAMYSAEDGTPGDFYLVHLGSRAQGGAGLLFTETTAVTPEGRISPGCTGIYGDEHVTAWKRIVD